MSASGRLSVVHSMLNHCVFPNIYSNISVPFAPLQDQITLQGRIASLAHMVIGCLKVRRHILPVNWVIYHLCPPKAIMSK